MTTYHKNKIKRKVERRINPYASFFDKAANNWRFKKQGGEVLIYGKIGIGKSFGF